MEIFGILLSHLRYKDTTWTPKKKPTGNTDGIINKLVMVFAFVSAT